MRRRLTYANVAATLALVFSMSGGALAASHYLITSSKQISPKVLKKLKGATGATGKQGPQGAQGKEGVAGKEGLVGKEGPKGETGPSHAYTSNGEGTASVTVPAGDYVVSGTGRFVNTSNATGEGECSLEGGGTTTVAWTSVSNVGLTEGNVYGEATIPVLLSATLKASGTISLRCREGLESQSAVTAAGTTITATPVGAIN